jgi:hypothetical protein
MTKEPAHPEQWDVVAAELKAYRDTQEQRWGTLDDVLLGRYLAGELDPAEKVRIEAEFKDHPELLKLTEIVRDVLCDTNATSSPPVQLALLAEPEPILKFEKPKFSRQPLMRLRSRGALAAAACVILALGVTLSRFTDDAVPRRLTRTDNRMVADAKGRKPGAVSISEKIDAALEGEARSQPVVTRRAIYERWQYELNSAPRVQAQPPAPTPPQAVSFTAKQDQPPDEKSSLASFFLVRSVNHVVDKALDATTERQRKASVALKQPGLVRSADKTLSVYGAHDPHNPANPYYTGYQVQAPGYLAEAEPALEKCVPVLVYGLKSASEAQVRLNCIESLGRMGPAARDAVPVLRQTIKSSKDPNEQMAVVNALGKLGPVARKAAPELLWLAQASDGKLKESANSALASIRNPYWIGVHDGASVFSAETCARVNERIEELHRRHGLDLVAETVHCLSPEAKKDLESRPVETRQDFFSHAAARRSKQIGGERGIYILICQDPPAVQVHLGKQAQEQAFSTATANSIKKVLLDGFEKKNQDEGLMQAVRYIESIAGK